MEPLRLNVRTHEKPDQQFTHSYFKYIYHKRLLIILMALITLITALCSIMVGSSNLSFFDVAAAVCHIGSEYNQIVVWNLRMPRVLTAIVGGIALAIAGCAFQSMLRNPLASATTLGISQGAAFGASVAIILLGAGSTMAYEGVQLSSNSYLTAICAFSGAMISTLVILGLSRIREMTPESIILAGVALSALFAGGTIFIQYFAEDSQVAAVVFWTFGDLSRVSYKEIGVMAIVTAFSTLFFIFNRWNLNAMETGEALAHGLGVNVKAMRAAGMIIAAAAAATITSFCGIINFVGLVAPHAMRRLVGSDYRFLLPASAFAGAELLLLSDILAHAIFSPLILPISAITSFVGAPAFLYLLFKGVRR